MYASIVQMSSSKKKKLSLSDETAKKREKFHLSLELQKHILPPLSKYALIGAGKTGLPCCKQLWMAVMQIYQLVCTKEAAREEEQEKQRQKKVENKFCHLLHVIIGISCRVAVGNHIQQFLPFSTVRVLYQKIGRIRCTTCETELIQVLSHYDIINLET